MLRESCPEIALTADVIVGFPGETDEDFAQTLDLMEKIRFDNLFSFKYSPREGTAAWALTGQIPEAMKRERLITLQRLQEAHTWQRNQAMMGKDVAVLVEGISKNRKEEVTGRTPDNKIVNFPAPLTVIGHTVMVAITDAFLHSLRGSMINERGQIMMIQMKVAGITIDPLTSTPIVILKDMEEKKAIPIWIGLFEASAIATRLENISFSRPMTHDLIKNIIDKLEAKLLKVEINDLKNNTYYAEMHLAQETGVIVIDARPSDAIAVALRTDAPIYVDDNVIERSRNVDVSPQGEELEKLKEEKLIEFLENLSPEDFGKYKM